MAYIVGSARIDEFGNATGGKEGDQKQTSTPDYKGEVSMQTFYVDKRGFYVLRLKKDSQAVKNAKAMETYCNDKHVGYNQDERLQIMTYDGTKDVNCDCGTLIRRCFKDATGKDPGNFTTSNERAVLLATGLVDDIGKYKAGMILYEGDILVTCTKGHTLAVVEGESRDTDTNTTKATVTYMSHIDGGNWLSEITGYNNSNSNGYSGVLGKAIDLVAMKLSKGKITYRVHSSVSKKWYSAVTGYSKTDSDNGYAGVKGKEIDGLAIKVSGADGNVKYRVHTIKSGWLPWVTGYNTSDSSNGYAGNLGENIDAIQISIQ